MKRLRYKPMMTAVFSLTILLFAPLQAGEKKSTVEEVRSALLSLPYYGVFDYLEFKLEGRTVTLVGEVTRPTLKSDAEAAVHRVKGVEVVNKIEVLPLSNFDDRIRRAVYRSVYAQTGLTRYGLGANPSIHIIVKNGNVTLKGVVDNQGDKNLAGIQARNVSGTFAVNNELIVAKGDNEEKTEKAEE